MFAAVMLFVFVAATTGANHNQIASSAGDQRREQAEKEKAKAAGGKSLARNHDFVLFVVVLLIWKG